MNIDFSYYMAIFLRRLPYFAVISALLTSAGLVVAMILPSEYRSTATLLVESSQIPESLAASTVRTRAQEQLQIIERTLLTRENLLDIANRLDVFASEDAITAGEIVERMRDQTSFSVQAQRNGATFFRASFQGQDPNLVARVTNEFVTLILDENVRIRTGLAGGTLEFFEDEVQRLSSELDNQSSEILKFRRENVNALPEDRTFLTNRLSGLKDRRLKAEQQIELIESQKQNAIVLFELTGSTGQTSGRSPEQAELASLERELEQAKAVFSSTHPRIRLLETRVAQAEARVAAALGAAESLDTSDSDKTQDTLFDLRLQDMDRQIASYQESIELIDEEIAEVDGWLAQIPSNSVVLDGLTRDYEQTRSQYQQASSRLSTAATGERIELLSKGQRIIVLEQATVPDSPIKPNRPIIAIGGLGAGISLGLGFIVLLELLNQSIRRPVEITDKLGITPFAVLPYIRTEAEARWRRTVLVGGVLAVVIGIPLLVWAIHSFVLPLDIYAERLLNKLGFSLSL